MRFERPLLLFLAAVCATRVLSGQEASDRLVERIVAAVDGRPVLLSETRALEALRGVDRETAVEALVDESLMLREALRLPQAAPTAEDDERAYLSLRTRAAAGSVPEVTLRRMARRQVIILKYIEVRFRPQVRVSDDDVRKVFESETGAGRGSESFAAEAPGIRERLTQAQLNDRVETWIKELRAAASIRLNPTEAMP